MLHDHPARQGETVATLAVLPADVANAGPGCLVLLWRLETEQLRQAFEAASEYVERCPLQIKGSGKRLTQGNPQT